MHVFVDSNNGCNYYNKFILFIHNYYNFMGIKTLVQKLVFQGIYVGIH